MTIVYRIVRAQYARTPFDGEGAYLYGGRWSSSGTRLCYASEHQSLAMLEYFVHLGPDDAPEDLVLASAEIPDDLPRKQLHSDDLPAHWRETPAPPGLAVIGDRFVREAAYPLLIVPSALVPSENNWLLNPTHPEFKKVQVRPSEPLSYDPRMFHKPGGRKRHRATGP